MKLPAQIVLLISLLIAFAMPLQAATKAQAHSTTTPLGLHRTPDGQLLLHGEPYRGIGVNYFNAFYRSLSGDNTTWRDGLHYLKQQNIPFIRFMAGAYWPNQWKLYLTDKPAYFARMDAFVRAAEQDNIGLIPSLFWQINTIPDIVFEPINKWGDPDSKTIQFMRTYTREVVSRYKDSPAIWAWEFGNEMNLEVDLPHHKPQVSVENGTPFMRTPWDRISTKDMTVALTEFAKTVREIDPTRLIISGHANPRPSAWHLMTDQSWTTDTAAQYQTMLAQQNPNPIDSISIHVYPDHANAYAFSLNSPTPLLTIIQTAKATAKELNKPLFIGEFGAPATLSPADEHKIFNEFLHAIKSAKVPLSAVWVFDYSPQDKDWNITKNNRRAYQIKAIGDINREWTEQLTTNITPPKPQPAQ